jgi:hypothetical protein
VFFVVPERPLPGSGERVRDQAADFGRIFTTMAFWRIALPVMLVQGT